MGYLYYDRMSQMLTLVADDVVTFLGPPTHSMLRLQEFGFSPSQSREAVLQAIFNTGYGVDLDHINRFAKSFTTFTTGRDGKDKKQGTQEAG